MLLLDLKLKNNILLLQIPIKLHLSHNFVPCIVKFKCRLCPVRVPDTKCEMYSRKYTKIPLLLARTIMYKHSLPLYLDQLHSREFHFILTYMFVKTYCVFQSLPSFPESTYRTIIFNHSSRLISILIFCKLVLISPSLLSFKT